MLRSRSTAPSSAAGCRTGCAIWSAETCGPRSAPSCGSRSTPARCSRTRPARPRALRRAHGVQRDEALPEGDIVDYLEEIGVRFGADLNAYTSFDETVYMLQVPTDTRGDRRQGARHPRDWADGVAFDPPRSRRSAASSSRSGGSAAARGMRILDKQLPVHLPGSKYADAAPDRHAARSSRRAGATRRALLQRLVSPGPDGGDRRRRLRPEARWRRPSASASRASRPVEAARARVCAGAGSRRRRSSRSRPDSEIRTRRSHCSGSKRPDRTRTTQYRRRSSKALRRGW